MRKDIKQDTEGTCRMEGAVPPDRRKVHVPGRMNVCVC